LTLPLRSVGASVLADGSARFTLWAPLHEEVVLLLDYASGGESKRRLIPMKKDADGYFEVEVTDCAVGSRYLYRLNGGAERPDPASRWQPDGVHASSAVAAHDFTWSDESWRGISLRDYRIYELHVGTFTPEGTFDSAIAQLDRLSELGITAIELMPVAQFPGPRNWGYDGVYPFAVQTTYGGADGLRRLVDACHRRGLAVILDVVYNHLGPEGNYLGEFAPYFTDRYKTPWGLALNFDGAHSDGVRNYFLSNAVQWIDDFHFDGLRLDAVHAIVDVSAKPFLQELAEVVHQRAAELQREVVLIAESDLNDPRLIRAPELGGIGLDAQWADDLHHALHAVLTGESSGYYADYGSVADVGRVMKNGYLFTGQYSRHRQRRFGAPPTGIDGSRFVVCVQNHDQVGNRMAGDRLAAAMSIAQQKVALAAVILSPFTPMLFMGEEYGEETPFQYFMSHSDPELVEAVRSGRREEFSAFSWSGEIPDPASEVTFQSSKLRPELSSRERKELHSFVQRLFRLRNEQEALGDQDLSHVDVMAWEKPRVLFMLRGSSAERLCLLFHFDEAATELTLPLPPGRWQLLFSTEEVSSELRSDGEVRLSLPPHACLVYRFT
jgi:maltooligosyltrehalose trehalohydrolase